MTIPQTSGQAAVSNLSAAAPPSPHHMISDGIWNQSTVHISCTLYLDSSLLHFDLSNTVSKESVPLTKYLITIKHAFVHLLSPLSMAINPSVELLEVFVSAGWDLNRHFKLSGDNGRRLSNLVANQEALVDWCFEHGVQVSDGAKDKNALK